MRFIAVAGLRRAVAAPAAQAGAGALRAPVFEVGGFAAAALAVMFTLALGGCAAEIRAADAAIEAKADEALGLAEDARCGRPIDSIARMAGRRGTDWLEGYLLSCPATLGAVMRTLMQQRLERLGVTVAPGGGP